MRSQFMYYQIEYTDKEASMLSFTGNQPIRIGQTVSCNVQLPPSEIYEPSIFASIIPTSDGWNLIKSTDYWSVEINGRPATIVQHLNDGDVLKFVDDEMDISLKFHVRGGEMGEGRYEKTRRLFSRFYTIAAVVLLLIVAAISFLFLNRERQMDIEPYELNIYHVSVDSVFLVCETDSEGVVNREVIAAIDLNSDAGQYQGTAFLTTDSLLVTARHCIEPWLGFEGICELRNIDDLSVDIRMAIDAETHNNISTDGTYKVYTHLIIQNTSDKKEMYSDSFCMDRSRDQILCLGSDNNPIYWRSIYPFCNNWQPELGDFAYVKWHEAGKIKLANMADMITFNKGKKRTVVALGYPENDASKDKLHTTLDKGEAQIFNLNDSKTEFKEDIQIHEIDLNHGNSGGPVFCLIDGDVKAIGIVSKADTKATNGTCYAVPVTEVNLLKAKGGKADETIYRR